MPENLGSAVLELKTDNTQLDAGLERAHKKAEDSLKELGNKFSKAGKKLSLALTMPIMAGFALALGQAAEQEAALAQLADAIRTTGKEGQISADAVAALAGELQRSTRFTDDQSIAAAALVQRFANLDQEGLLAIIPRLQNLSTVMGVDMQTAAMQLGKFIDGATDSLGRYRIPVEEGATQSERLASAVAFMDEKFQGAAETAGRTGTGPMVTLKNSVFELAESFGTILLPVMQKLSGWLQGIVDWLGKMDPSTRVTIITIAALVAAIGPLLLIGGQLITGIATIMTVIKGVGGVMSIVSAGPIGIIILAVAALALGVYLLIKNWDTVKAFFIDLWDKVKDAFASAIDWIKSTMEKVVAWMWDNAEYLALALSPLASAAVLIIKNWSSIEDFFRKLWAKVTGFFQDARDKIKNLTDSIYDNTIGRFGDLFRKLVGGSVVPDMVNKIIDEFQRMKMSSEDWIKKLIDSAFELFQSGFEAIGQSIVEGASAWDIFKDAAKETIATLLVMLGKQLLLYAVAAFVPLPGFFNPVGAVLAIAAAAACFIGAGVIRALGEGGWINEPVMGVGLRTGTGYLMGERGPEYVSPGDAIGGRVLVQINNPILAGGNMREWARILRQELESLRILGT